MDNNGKMGWQGLGNVVRIGSQTASSRPLTTRPIASAPTTDEECRALRAWAESIPSTIPVPATTEQITKHLAFLASTLPSKNIDEKAGQMRFSVYVSMLSGFSDGALAHMSRRVCETLDWFPTPHQCLELAREYSIPPSDKVKAIADCNAYDQRAFETWLASIHGNPEPNLEVPKFWREVALTRTLLRKLDDGSIVTRERFRDIRAGIKADAA